MVSTRGFEPPTPGFIPLRLSPPLSRSWSGLSLHRRHVAVRCRPSSLYTLPRISPGLGSGLAYWKTSEAFPDFERFDQTSFLVRPPIHRNPVLYPAELRGLTGECKNWISYPHEGGNRKIEPVDHPKCDGKTNSAKHLYNKVANDRLSHSSTSEAVPKPEFISNTAMSAAAITTIGCWSSLISL